MQTNIYKQHEDHSAWLSKLAFYNDEIKILQNRLGEVNTGNTAQDVRKDVEHFQNQFLIQENTIHSIKQHIARDEKQIQANIANNPVSSDHRKAEDHTEEREMVESFERNFTELKKEFNTFVSKWL